MKKDRTLLDTAPYLSVGLLLFNSVYADFLAVFVKALKLNGSVNKSKQSVIRTLTDIVAGMNMGSTLSDKDVAGKYILAVTAFYTKSLGFGVPSVVRGTLSFFMRKELNINFKHVLHLSEVNVVRILSG